MDGNRGAAERRDTGKDKLTAELAYRLWQENGCVEGRALDYWLEAERQIRHGEAGSEEGGRDRD
jgi:hypothetical protein